TLSFLRGTAPRRDHLASRQERAGHRHRLIEQSAGIIAQVDHVAHELLRRYLLPDLADRLFQSVGGLFVERGDPDIADVAAVGMIADRPHPNDLAHDRYVD